VPPSERLEIDDLGYRDDGILHITARFGFQDETDVPALVRAAAAGDLECEIHLQKLSYFVSRITIALSDEPGMARWRKRLFLAISRNAADPSEYFRLPVDRTVVMGSVIPL
jgi:KUP system potassium uptake protein